MVTCRVKSRQHRSFVEPMANIKEIFVRPDPVTEQRDAGPLPQIVGRSRQKMAPLRFLFEAKKNFSAHFSPRC
jgi:hypothetical protein